MKQVHHEEIDLVALLAKSIRAFRRNLVLILICFGATIGLAVWIWSTSPKVYESRMIIYSSILTESYCVELGENINALVNDRNYPELAARLGITEQQASAMKGALETVPEESRFAIVVTVRTIDNAILPDLQKGLMQYISQNDFVKLREDEKKRGYQELIERISDEIDKLEAVKQRFVQGSANSGGMVLMDPSDAYMGTVALVQQKVEAEEMLKLASAVQLVEGFVPLKKPVGPRLLVLLAGALVAGLVLSTALIGFRYAWVIAQHDE
jgi:hypothetical protein